MQKTKKKSKSQQRPSSATTIADYAESPTDEVDEDVEEGKDFGILINAPLSKGGHFVFKSEKAWTIDSSQYSEFFTLNLKALSAAIDCVPFKEYVDVTDKYFVSDQLTSMFNDAEKGKAAYNMILNDLSASNLSDTKGGSKENTRIDQSQNVDSITNVKSEDSIDDLEEDLDFLLSLKEPVQSTVISQPVIGISLSTSHNTDSKTKLKSVPNKPIDLEKWLDSVLDD
ncbi:PREDICTED: uncharacterized protein LOC108771201 [Cyphomyrmex costatus]|uniref:Cell death regulator Aven n=1 Tax=Cyphomyrmex costatus TaxID=456900 RepID=A0A151K248_9HYME|nr:PREDICTED: uncharacterized protein LOC108771201 [Cyphomyrmex costatus]KYN50199.1 hypothetical protein ALC62_03828 [Cyphomyrmex costatus]